MQEIEQYNQAAAEIIEALQMSNQEVVQVVGDLRQNWNLEKKYILSDVELRPHIE
jgi:hypothetical protein